MKDTGVRANQHLKSHDPTWYFLAEFSLSEFLLDHNKGDELIAKLLLQMVRELGIPPACAENIEMALAEFANEARTHLKPKKSELPEHIRVFCQKKMIDIANVAGTSEPGHNDQGMKHAQVFPHPVGDMVGGWGYFLIERGEDLLSCSSMNPGNCIDLYLYKEGK